MIVFRRAMRPRVVAALLVVASLAAAAPANAQSFFTNYLKPEYLVPVGDFSATSGGDLHVTYHQLQVPVLANGELLLFGEFPRARYFTITVYDDHGAVIGALNDDEIRVYGSSMNPYAIGGPTGAEDVLYAVTVRLSGGLATSPVSTCATPLSVHANVVDARSRHTAGSFYSAAQSGFSADVNGIGTVTHVDATNNTAVLVMIRSYLRQPVKSQSQFDLRKPLAWIRASTTGCPAQLAPAGQSLSPSQWYTMQQLLKTDQMYAHIQHEIDLGVSSAFGSDPIGDADWFGLSEYVPGQAVGRYVAAELPIDVPTLNAQNRVLRLQLRLPRLCRVSLPCALDGTEELKYWSLTFEDENGQSQVTFSDFHLVPDANGYATVAVSFGTALPAHVTSQNGYTRIVLSALPVARAVLRNYVPRPNFGCSTDTVPPRTAEYHSNGGYMGEYLPVISFPTAGTLPVTATPLVQSGSCEL